MELSFPQLINHWVLQTIAVTLTAFLIPRLRVTSLFGALSFAVAISLVNATVWNAGLFSELPTAFSSYTLTVLVTNGAIFWFLVKILPGIESDGIIPVLVGPIIFTICSVLVNKYGRDIDWIAVGTQAIAWLQSLRDTLTGEAPPPHTP